VSHLHGGIHAARKALLCVFDLLHSLAHFSSKASLDIADIGMHAPNGRISLGNGLVNSVHTACLHVVHAPTHVVIKSLPLVALAT
jgi:hypothetical protein